MPSGKKDFTIAVARNDEHFVERHSTFLRLIREQRIDVLLLGDSITRRWVESPEEWSRWFGDLNAANFGVGADCVENLLWRVRNGELDGVSPKVVILLIGTNNIPINTPREIAEGISAVVETILTKLPRANLVLLGVLPRGPQKPEDGSSNDPYFMDKIIAVNNLIASLGGRRARFLDVGAAFIGPDGEIRPDLMPDRVHLVAPGYRVLGSHLRPLINELID